MKIIISQRDRNKIRREQTVWAQVISFTYFIQDEPLTILCLKDSEKYFVSLLYATHLITARLTFVGAYYQVAKRFLMNCIWTKKMRELYSSLFCHFNNSVLIVFYFLSSVCSITNCKCLSNQAQLCLFLVLRDSAVILVYSSCMISCVLSSNAGSSVLVSPLQLISGKIEMMMCPINLKFKYELNESMNFYWKNEYFENNDSTHGLLNFKYLT